MTPARAKLNIREKNQSSTHQHIPISVTWDQAAAFRLGRHHLVERAAAKTLISVAGDMGGAQAQLLSAAQISLWTRVRGLRIADVEEALRERTLVKASCMRRTLFLVPSHELAIFALGAARRAEKEVQWTLGRGVPERVVDAAIDAMLGALDQPLTRPEIAERVSRTLGVRRQAVHGGGWGRRSKIPAVPVGHLTFPVVDLLHLAGARGVVCYGPYRGNEPTFVRADAWIPRWQAVPREQAEGILLRRYLRSFGPATAADFAFWSGMTLTEARQVWAREQADFAPVDVEGWAAFVLQEDLDELTQARFERPRVRLLPYFDTYLLGHKERHHLVSMEHHPKVYRAQGWIAPVVLVNGRVAAVWEHAREGNHLHVNVSKIESLSRRIIAGIREEAQDLSRFLGTQSVDVQVGDIRSD
ncbi:MAG TPA: winged helix DNA-binding domain-containing protein [Anaerolineales bacterium]|nr:winged helix DNA-binding domain-containing protein [Anaerolineales bacterium]